MEGKSQVLPKSQCARKAWIAPKNTFANPSQSNPNSKHHLLSNKTHPSIWATSSKPKKSIFFTPEVLFFSGIFGGKNWKDLQLPVIHPSQGQSSIGSRPRRDSSVEPTWRAHQRCFVSAVPSRTRDLKSGQRRVCYDPVIRKVCKKNTFKMYIQTL